MAKKLDFRIILDRLRHISFDFNTIKKYMWVIHLIIIAIIAKSASGILVTYLDHKIESQRKTRPKHVLKPFLPTSVYPELGDFSIILKRNIFNPNAADEDLLDKIVKKSVGLDESGAVPSSLPLELVGTIILSDPARSVAAVKHTSKNSVESYQMGDTIIDMAKVYKVTAHKIYLQNLKSGQLEFVAMKKTKISSPLRTSRSRVTSSGEGIRQTGEDSFIIDRGMLEATLANPSEILTQARAVPNIVAGKIQGFRIFSIRPGSIYEKLGIKNGDVVRRVNGIELDSPAKALEFYGAISSATDITIDIERGGQRRSFTYQVR